MKVVFERLKSKIVRMRGAKAIMVSRKQRGFQGQPGDIPLACFAYIVPGGDEAHTLALRRQTPPPLAPVPESAQAHIRKWNEIRNGPRTLDVVEDTEGATVRTEDWSHIGT